MKKKFLSVLCFAMIFSLAACGEPESETVDDVKIDVTIEKETTDSELSEDKNIPNFIEDQSFEIKLDEWGEVLFASVAPENNIGNPAFLLLKDGQEVYSFPTADSASSKNFTAISAVSFKDFNMDNKMDVLVLVQYTDGSSTWNEPQIFLQENSDSMFYLDYPNLTSYKVESVSADGPSFYRDTFLEEYLSKQDLTDKISDLASSWSDYIAYVDEHFNGVFSVEKQLTIFAEQRDVWIEDLYFADERYCYTIAPLAFNGRLTLIVSNFGGTGFYTYTQFYQIDETGNVAKMDTTFTEYQSQPDLMDEGEIIQYSNVSSTDAQYYYVVHDQVKVSPANYVYETGAISITDDKITYTTLAVQEVLYDGPDFSETITCRDSEGNTLTQEEYNNYANTHYSDLSYTKNAVSLEWMDVSSITAQSDDAAFEQLLKVYQGFVRN